MARVIESSGLAVRSFIESVLHHGHLPCAEQLRSAMLQRDEAGVIDAIHHAYYDNNSLFAGGHFWLIIVTMANDDYDKVAADPSSYTDLHGILLDQSKAGVVYNLITLYRTRAILSAAEQEMAGMR